MTSTVLVAGTGLPCALAGSLENMHIAVHPDELDSDSGSAVPWSREAGIVDELDCWVTGSAVVLWSGEADTVDELDCWVGTFEKAVDPEEVGLVELIHAAKSPEAQSLEALQNCSPIAH